MVVRADTLKQHRWRLAASGIVASAFALLIAGHPEGLAAQQLPARFRSSSDTVEVHATVKLRNGTIARDLTKDDFELLEDGKTREITVFSKSVQPLSVALVLDHSGSTAPDFANVLVAAQEFVGHLLRGDRAAVSSLSWDCQPFTDNTSALMTVLRMRLPTDFGSPIWSATDRAMDALADEGGRRIILLLSDGQDTQQMASTAFGPRPPMSPPRELLGMSPCQWAGELPMRSSKDVVNRAERDAVMIYTVSVGSGHADLSRIAKQTGASYQELAHYDELRDAFRSIADELHLQYVLGFAPSFTDGQSHKIEVKVKRSGVTVQARKAYTANK
jgi:VWFA-related protein